MNDFWNEVVDLEEKAAAIHKKIHCVHPSTHREGGQHSGAGDVWDDIREVCEVCGAEV